MIVEPETIISQSFKYLTFSKLIPPSTLIKTSSFRLFISSYNLLILVRVSFLNSWPGKPGVTAINKTKSILSK